MSETNPTLPPVSDGDNPADVIIAAIQHLKFGLGLLGIFPQPGELALRFKSPDHVSRVGDALLRKFEAMNQIVAGGANALLEGEDVRLLGVSIGVEAS